MKSKVARFKTKRFISIATITALCAGLFMGETGSLHVSAETVSGNDIGQGIAETISGNDPEEVDPAEADVSGNDLPTNDLSLLSAGAAGLTEAAKLALAGKTSDAITIDGNLSEGIWSRAEAYSIEQLADFTISNNRAEFKTTWDAERLYTR